MFCTSSRLTPRPAFTLSEVLITLGIIGLIAALTGAAVKINDHLKTEQSTKRIEGSIMEIKAAFAKWQASGGAVPLSTDPSVLNDMPVMLQYLGKPYTGPFKLYDPNIAQPCVLHKCVQLSNGSVVLFYKGDTLNFYQTAWVYDTTRFGRIAAHGLHLDPNPQGTTIYDSRVDLAITNRGAIMCNEQVHIPWFPKHLCSDSLKNASFVRTASTPSQIQTDFASQGF